MKDNDTTIKQLKETVRTFTDERDWNQFHAPKNMVMALSVEVAELVELLQWVDSEASLQRVNEVRSDIEDEVSDVLHALIAFANICDIDMAAAFEKKMVKNRAKYPVEESRGRNVKYTQLARERSSKDD